ncbi:serine hydrolase [Amycolatopsis magusensis]|uniref:serine hydrolase n=1 Tax=Amycolatopsis magusensis TaxID=882444 RepID=UPI0035569527
MPDYFEKRRSGPSLYEHLRAGRDQAWSFEDVLRIAREQQHPHFVPQDLTATRQKARYSDTGFQLLIRIVEAVTGRSFAGLLAERITTPLGLTRTWLPGQARSATDTTAPLSLHTGQRRVELTSMIESSNDLVSTTGEPLTFQRALLAGEVFDHARSAEPLTERRNRLRNATGSVPCSSTSAASCPRAADHSRSSATPASPGPGRSTAQNSTCTWPAPSTTRTGKLSPSASWRSCSTPGDGDRPGRVFSRGPRPMGRAVLEPAAKGFRSWRTPRSGDEAEAIHAKLDLPADWPTESTYDPALVHPPPSRRPDRHWRRRSLG